MSAIEADNVPGEFDRRALHAQADAEKRDALLAGELDRLDLSLNPALAEAAGDKDAVVPGQ